MRVVIDTNLLFDSVAPKGDKHWVLDSFFDGKFTWIFSNEILSEYAEVLAESFGEKTITFTISALVSSFLTMKDLNLRISIKWLLMIKTTINLWTVQLEQMLII